MTLTNLQGLKHETGDLCVTIGIYMIKEHRDDIGSIKKSAIKFGVGMVVAIIGYTLVDVKIIT